MAGERGWNGNDFVVPTGGFFKGDKSVQISVVDPATALATGDGKFYFLIDSTLNGYKLTSVLASVITAGTTNTLDIQIANVTDAVDILSTKLTVDSTETSSLTAATPAVINAANANVSTMDLLRIDIDAIHAVPTQGLIVVLLFSPV